MHKMMDRSVFVYLSVLVLSLLVAIIVPSILLANTRVVTLDSASQFGGSVSQAIGINDKKELQTEGVDYRLVNTTYFGSNQWVVSRIHSLTGGDDGYVILQKQHNIYRVVLGPGTAFDSSYTKAMPRELVNYITLKGLVYES